MHVLWRKSEKRWFFPLEILDLGLSWEVGSEKSGPSLIILNMCT